MNIDDLINQFAVVAGILVLVVGLILLLGLFMLGMAATIRIGDWIL